jgi:hypothetical protein
MGTISNQGEYWLLQSGVSISLRGLFAKIRVGECTRDFSSLRVVP